VTLQCPNNNTVAKETWGQSVGGVSERAGVKARIAKEQSGTMREADKKP
jgi:hypothetical protein